MNNRIKYFTLLARYLRQSWGDAYYDYSLDSTYYNESDLHYFPVDGLTQCAIEDLSALELSSYVHRIIWHPDGESTLLSCLGPELRTALQSASDGKQLRLGLKDYLFTKVKEQLKGGLLADLKAKDDHDWVREYVGRRAEFQLAGNFGPYGSGDGMLLAYGKVNQVPVDGTKETVLGTVDKGQIRENLVMYQAPLTATDEWNRLGNKTNVRFNS